MNPELQKLRDELELEFERADPDRVHRLMDALDNYLDARIVVAVAKYAEDLIATLTKSDPVKSRKFNVQVGVGTEWKTIFQFADENLIKPWTDIAERSTAHGLQMRVIL